MKRITCIPFLLIFISLFFSCNEDFNKYDSFYCLALKQIEDNNISEAIELLQKSQKKASSYFATLSTLELISILPHEKAIIEAEKAYTANPENNDILFSYLSLLYQEKNYQKIVLITSSTESSISKIIGIRLLSLYALKDPSFNTELKTWFTYTDITTSHIQFANEWNSFTENTFSLESESFEDSNDIYYEIKLLISFRNAVYSSQYKKALLFLEEYFSLFESPENCIVSFPRTVLSDIGKTYLYASSDRNKDIRFFSTALNKVNNNEQKFILLFYIGRYYEKLGGSNLYNAIESFNKAIDNASSELDFDNALWYYLSNCRKISDSLSIQQLYIFAQNWHDPDYFDDYFETLSYSLLSRKDYKTFYEVFQNFATYMSPVSFTKYGYISARLIQENLITVSQGKESLTTSLFQDVWNKTNGSLYYKLLAGQQYNVSSSEMKNVLVNEKNKQKEIVSDTEKLLLMYVEFELYDRVFTFFKQNIEDISLDVAIEVANKTSNYAKTHPEYYDTSLRIAALALSANDKGVTTYHLNAVYPRYFQDEVEAVAKEFNISDYLIYGLVRTESFFNKNIVSSAGAIGLSQLMPSTANDIARKLKISDYSLTDSYTNLRFGVFYLDELIRRLDGSIILSLFSYNGGITRVRNWVKANPNLPKDLFLEIIPYTETRDYGRKVLSAAVVYASLYSEKEPNDIILEIMN